MITVDIREAKKHLSTLVERASKGEAFVITRAGKPLVKVVALDETKMPRRLGFLKGQFKVPGDFNTMGQAEIAKLFGTDK